MGWAGNDQDGILSCCPDCGSHAGWRPSPYYDGRWAAVYTSCGRKTSFCRNKYEAAVEWHSSDGFAGCGL